MTALQAFQGRIEYSDSLLRKLEETISIAIGYSRGDIKLTRRPKEHGDSFYCGLSMKEGDCFRRYIQSDSRAAEWTVVKAIKKGASLASAWIGIRMRFEKGGEEDYLVSASVIVLALRSSLYPLIRAEWDYRGLEEKKHGQPHWHVLTALQAKTNGALSNNPVGPVDFVLQPPDASSEEMESIHLAMASNWTQRGGNEHIYSISNVEELSNWFRGVLYYSIDQVQYALNKTGKTPDLPVGVFVAQAS
jgi:hypothetical protein